jgi:hypothetical protein
LSSPSARSTSQSCGVRREILEIVDSDAFRDLTTKCPFLLEDWHSYTFVTGEQTQSFIDRYATVGGELGYI